MTRGQTIKRKRNALGASPDLDQGLPEEASARKRSQGEGKEKNTVGKSRGLEPDSGSNPYSANCQFWDPES